MSIDKLIKKILKQVEAGATARAIWKETGIPKHVIKGIIKDPDDYKMNEHTYISIRDAYDKLFSLLPQKKRYKIATWKVKERTDAIINRKTHRPGTVSYPMKPILKRKN